MLVTFADRSTETYEDMPLKAGSEGAIYLSQDKRSVVKLYHPDTSKDLDRKDRIDKLINSFNPTKDDPYWNEFFTWPEKRVEQPRVGYRMRFAGKMKTLDHYIFATAYKYLKPEEKGWFIGYIATAIKLTSAADRLARMGLCYPDFSEKNLLVEPFEGRMVLIDCDSLTVPGKLSPTVQGTSWYRAPEIVSGKTRIPSVETDRHALAVLLYLWLLRGHPLCGDKKFDPTDPDRDDQLRLGEKALYIEHPIDHSNRNSHQVVKAAALGPELEKLFQIAFVDGLHEPRRRPLPIQWQEALHRTYDRIIPCASAHCSWRFFVARPMVGLACPMCGERMRDPQYLPFVYLFTPRRTGRLGDFNMSKGNAHYVVGWPGRYLHLWHTSASETVIYSDPSHITNTVPCAIFEFEGRSKQWYLKNLTLPKMLYRVQNDPGGTWRLWPINSSVPLEMGMQIQFGDGPDHYRAQIELIRVA